MSDNTGVEIPPMIHIALISPYSELTELARRVAGDLQEPLLIKQAVLEESIQIVKEFEAQGVDVVISRGATAEMIRRHTTIPIVLCEATIYDVLLVLHEARRVDRRIALVIYSPIPGLERLGRIIDVEVEQICYYEDYQGIDRKIEECINNGFRVVAGSLVAVKLAREKGLTGIPIYTSKETLREAVLKAREIAVVRHMEAKRAMRTKAILDFTYEGIVVTDENGVVEIFNPAAEKITGIKASESLGRHVEGIIPTSRLMAVKESRVPEIGELQEIGKTTVVTNRVPILVKDKVTGVVATFHEASKIADLENKIRKHLYDRGLVAKYCFKDIIGQSEAITKAKLQASRYATYDTTVLLTGETGTGKELFAQSIHNASPRKHDPFVAVNCSALPESLLESELFGYEEGAFTGAKRGGKPGLFELAHQGTIFLDEISAVSMNMQSRLLRVIQENEVMRLGSNKLIPINVRIIAATNEDLAGQVAGGKFRKDLYFRLNILNVYIPPLRERVEDIPLLAEHFLHMVPSQLRKGFINEILLKKMYNYRWPGNIRELLSFITRYSILRNEVAPEEIFDQFLKENSLLQEQYDSEERAVTTTAGGELVTIKISTLAEMEKAIIKDLLAYYDHNRSVVARVLGISRSTLWKKLKGEQGVQE